MESLEICRSSLAFISFCKIFNKFFCFLFKKFTEIIRMIYLSWKHLVRKCPCGNFVDIFLCSINNAASFFSLGILQFRTDFTLDTYPETTSWIFYIRTGLGSRIWLMPLFNIIFQVLTKEVPRFACITISRIFILSIFSCDLLTGHPFKNPSAQFFNHLCILLRDALLISDFQNLLGSLHHISVLTPVHPQYALRLMLSLSATTASLKIPSHFQKFFDSLIPQRDILSIRTVYMPYFGSCDNYRSVS